MAHPHITTYASYPPESVIALIGYFIQQDILTPGAPEARLKSDSDRPQVFLNLT